MAGLMITIPSNGFTVALIDSGQIEGQDYKAA